MRGKHSTQRVDYELFEPLLQQIMQKYETNQTEVLRTLGYRSSNGIAFWKKTGKVPLVAVNAAKGVLADAGETWEAQQQMLPLQPAPPLFDFEELSMLLAVVTGHTVLDGRYRDHLIRKLALELIRQ